MGRNRPNFGVRTLLSQEARSHYQQALTIYRQAQAPLREAGMLMMGHYRADSVVRVSMIP